MVIITVSLNSHTKRKILFIMAALMHMPMSSPHWSIILWLFILHYPFIIPSLHSPPMTSLNSLQMNLDTFKSRFSSERRRFYLHPYQHRHRESVSLHCKHLSLSRRVASHKHTPLGFLAAEKAAYF